MEYDLIVPTEFNKLYIFSSSHLIYFVFILSKWNWPMYNVFLDLFSNLFSLVFFKLWLFVLLNMQNNENNYEGAERKERKKNKKDHIQ